MSVENGVRSCDGGNEEEIREEGEDVVTLKEVLEEELALQEDSLAVLGGSDDTACSYPLGYVKRQALYSCKSCVKNDVAAICLACSLSCHDGHDLIELYTKRHFRCDCGNSKFPAESRCNLFPEKDTINAENEYNHNFRDRYCICARPYPDPEDDVKDEMVQCTFCEDWFHTRHLSENDTPFAPAPNEIACKGCVEKHPFLAFYSEKKGGEEDVPVEVCANEEEGKNPVICKVKGKEPESSVRTLFFSQDWRNQLCRCDDCLKMYEEQKCSFLLDEEDSVAAYEKKAAATNQTPYSAGMEALGKLGHVSQREMLTEFNDLKSNLNEYLEDFARSGKVVKREDIEGFFQDLKAKKRPRLEMPNTCR